MPSFMKQPLMRRVLVSLAPLYLFSIWLYGWRLLAVAAVSFTLGFLVEFLFERKRSGKVSEAVFVTCALYSLALPPNTPLWIVGVGILFAVFMAKEVYGGFGRNIFNPAMAGRLFVYIAFATVLNRGYSGWGAFGTSAVDVVASATPLALMRANPGASIDILPLLIGTRPGAVGESPSLLIILSAIYLMVTKTASWRIILSTTLGAAAFNAIFFFGGVRTALPPESLLAGSFLFVTVFMATDPISAAKKPMAQLIYGALIGACVVLIRTFSAFPEGTSFAVLLGNTFACFLDEIVDKFKKTPALKEAAR